MHFESVIGWVAKGVEGLAVTVIVVGIAVSLVTFLLALRGSASGEDDYRLLRRRVGRSILLGLELIVAGDIIRTLTVSPTFQTVGVLAVIVVIRTFLSLALEVELTGRWPWQEHDGAG